ncbi:helix-turn-helix domain-containing protein [Pseudokineococcus basanitobsidens]|uniref:Helix-turn-helix domain-containing protein n=1 Tax=Pseudokineococcus basanitobsidens TaxID=1926649 RepID=A0ABU8RN60_9ACTN
MSTTADRRSGERLGEVLAASGLGMTSGELVASLEELLGATASPREDAPLTVDQERYLRERAGLDVEAATDTGAARRAGLAASARLVATSLTGAELARRAGVDDSTVRHWARHGDVVVVGEGRRRRYPAFQVGADGRPLPGLRAVLSALPPGWHPLALEAWMTRTDADLEVDGRAVSPAAWLADGGPVAAVVVLAEGVGARGGTSPTEVARVRAARGAGRGRRPGERPEDLRGPEASVSDPDATT